MIATNTAWNCINFRSGLIKALIAQGYNVVAVAPRDEYAHQLKALGCRYIPLPMDNKGKHIGRDLVLLARFYVMMRAEKPDVFLGFTVKPNVYGSLAAHAMQIPVINNVAGLGTAFVQGNWLTRLVQVLYRIALCRSSKVFFQNDDDRNLFVSAGIVSEAITERLPGSGVDLLKFQPSPLPAHQVFRFLLIARMLWDKGVGEYVAAARSLKLKGLEAECCMLGFLDVQNPSAISSKQMDYWVSEGAVNYLGVRNDVREEIALADCIVLPSFYREGTPRVLLEAAAMARPIVTTDSVGCRDVVDDGVTGFLCNPRDASDLADKMTRVASLSLRERKAMGVLGRKKIERQFDEKIIIRKYLKSIDAAILKK